MRESQLINVEGITEFIKLPFCNSREIMDRDSDHQWMSKLSMRSFGGTL